MKQLTPLEKIIEFIDESAGQMPLEGVLDYAKSLLKEERQVIVDAFIQGIEKYSTMVQKK
jgi:hypothetical protein